MIKKACLGLLVLGLLGCGTQQRRPTSKTLTAEFSVDQVQNSSFAFYPYFNHPQTAYTWNFGDNSTIEHGSYAVHMYTPDVIPTLYWVTLQIDFNGKSRKATRSVTVPPIKSNTPGIYPSDLFGFKHSFNRNPYK